MINSYDYGDFNGVIDRRRDSAGLQVLSGEDPIARGLAMLVRGRLDAYLVITSYSIHYTKLYEPAGSICR